MLASLFSYTNSECTKLAEDYISFGMVLSGILLAGNPMGKLLTYAMTIITDRLLACSLAILPGLREGVRKWIRIYSGERKQTKAQVLFPSAVKIFSSSICAEGGCKFCICKSHFKYSHSFYTIQKRSIG